MSKLDVELAHSRFLSPTRLGIGPSVPDKEDGRRNDQGSGSDGAHHYSGNAALGQAAVLPLVNVGGIRDMRRNLGCRQGVRRLALAARTGQGDVDVGIGRDPGLFFGHVEAGDGLGEVLGGDECHVRAGVVVLRTASFFFGRSLVPESEGCVAALGDVGWRLRYWKAGVARIEVAIANRSRSIDFREVRLDRVCRCIRLVVLACVLFTEECCAPLSYATLM